MVKEVILRRILVILHDEMGGFDYLNIVGLSLTNLSLYDSDHVLSSKGNRSITNQHYLSIPSVHSSMSEHTGCSPCPRHPILQLHLNPPG